MGIATDLPNTRSSAYIPATGLFQAREFALSQRAAPRPAAPAPGFHEQPTKHLDALTLRAARAFVDSGLHGRSASVVAAIDTSSAMAPHFESGLVDDLATALLALGMRFDDDGVVPVWTFAESANFVGDMARGEHTDFVLRHIPTPSRRHTSTRLAPLVDAICRQHFPREWANPDAPQLRAARPHPLFVIVVTAGDCVDMAEAKRALRRASHLPIFWQFAGIAPDDLARDFPFLETLDELPGAFIDSCGFFAPESPEDEVALFAGLLGEFPRYLARPGVQAMLYPAPARDARSARTGRTARPTDDPTERAISQTILALPEDEHDRRARARRERERRRAERDAHPDAVIPPIRDIRTSADLSAYAQRLEAPIGARGPRVGPPRPRDTDDAEDTVKTTAAQLARRAREAALRAQAEAELCRH